MASDAADARAYSAVSPVTVVDVVPLESVLRGGLRVRVSLCQAGEGAGYYASPNGLRNIRLQVTFDAGVAVFVRNPAGFRL